jgi:hypothetical protein
MMTPLPLVGSFGLFCFCLTGPVGWPFTIAAGVALGWNAALYWAARQQS